MTLLNREKLLTKEKLDVTKVDLGKGEFVYVRQMTGRERDTFEQSIISFDKDGGVVRKTEDFRSKLAVCTVCDADGELLLKPTDVGLLSQSMSAAKLEEIVNVAQKINKISAEDKEELTKKSKGGRAASSTSGSAKN
jgi:hypothetical protein